MDFRKIRDKCISVQVHLWLDEVTLVHFQQGAPTLECRLILTSSNTWCTVLGLSDRTPVPYSHNSASVCLGFFRTFRITANFSLRVKPLLNPLRVGAPNDAPLSFKCLLINRLTVVRGTPSCREISELFIPDLLRESKKDISCILYSWRVIFT